MRKQEEKFTVEELEHEVSRRLADYGLLNAQHDGRVSPVPDARTIRYYATLGLLDPPMMEDRQARYVRRHLLQILAIKALQGVSLPLSTIQSQLYGKSNAELEQLLAALAEEQQRRHQVHPVIWREVTLEPGLKIIAQEGWSSILDLSELEKRIHAAVSALRQNKE
jgi:DNA-binding transcriptional MerR regulator